MVHRKTTTFVGGLRLGGMTAQMVLDDAMTIAAIPATCASAGRAFRQGRKIKRATATRAIAPKMLARI
jgi:hypothetical protein